MRYWAIFVLQLFSKGALLDLRQFLATESPSKMIFKIFVLKKNGLIRKIRLISKFMTSQPVKQTIAMHMLPNISRGKGNIETKL